MIGTGGVGVRAIWVPQGPYISRGLGPPSDMDPPSPSLAQPDSLSGKRGRGKGRERVW